MEGAKQERSRTTTERGLKGGFTAWGFAKRTRRETHKLAPKPHKYQEVGPGDVILGLRAEVEGFRREFDRISTLVTP
jgi:hypothetical protein